MSLPQEWTLQDSRGSLHCASEPDPTGGIQHQSGGFICASTGTFASGSSTANIEVPNTRTCIGSTHSQTPTCNFIDEDYPIVACSQPAEPSLLTECQQSTGSLFSVVSAPPVPVAEQTNTFLGGSAVLNGCSVTDSIANVGGGLGMGIGLQPNCLGLGLGMPPIGGSVQNTISGALSNSSIAEHNSSSIEGSGTATMPRRPVTLPIDSTPYSPASILPPTRTLHASLLVHQISEIEEDDNENLLTVSSITARPLIAKSREICSSRQQPEKAAKCGGRQMRQRASGDDVQATRRVTVRDSVVAVSASSRSSENSDPPDGGYGWFIVLGAFFVQFWVAGLVKSYGVLYVEITETFPQASAALVSWIPAILSALCLALAPLSSALCQRFSCRAVVFVGGLFCALGMTLSYFATSLLHLLFTFGILTGIGGGLSTTPGVVIVSQYFDKHRAMANGICVSGTAAGSFILPILIKHLAEEYKFHGTILILGGCMLHVCISATLYKPIEQYLMDANKTTEEDEECGKPLNHINPSNTGMLTTSTYLDTCEDDLNNKYIEHLFLEETKNRLNDYYSSKNLAAHDKAQESDDEVKDIVGETTFIKPMKKVRSSGILHSVEDLSTDSTWVYRKHSGTDSNRGSRRRRNVFANDEIISKIQAHLEKPLSPPAVVTRGLSKSMEIPTPVSSMNEWKPYERSTGTDLNTCTEEEDDDEPQTCCERIEMYLDISLLKEPTFILMCLSVTLMSVGCPYMLYFLPSHVIALDYDKSAAGYLVAISAVLDLIGRLGLGYLSDLQIFDRKKTYVVCILGAGVAVLTIPSAATFRLLTLSVALYGLCLGSWYVLMPVLLADIFGTDRISSSYGLVRMFQSIGAISVPPLAGYLRDLTGSFQICFYCMGTCMVLGCLPLLAWILWDQRALLNGSADSDETSTVS